MPPLSDFIGMHQIIEKALLKCDIKPESRAFLPHLTLGKTKGKCYPINKEIKVPQFNFTASNIKLFRSDMGNEGSVYTPLVCIVLGAK